jgi:hypothetical protein
MTDQSNGGTVRYNAFINMKVAGVRVITPNGITCNGVPGQCSGDNLTGLGQYWLRSGINPAFDADITSESSSVWPSTTIEVVTDQGTG